MLVGLPRMHLFEWNDLAWAPAPLRETIVEALSRTVRWSGMLREVVGPFRSFLAATGTTEVLELGAGAAGPSMLLLEELLRAGVTPPRFVLTDLFPRLDVWRDACARHPGLLDHEPTPVDATCIPPSLGAGRARMLINAFHHFPPELARSVLADAVRSSAGIFVSEPFERNPLRTLAIVPTGIPALVTTPLFTRRSRAAKALLIWATPTAAVAGAWDTLVSSLRVYSEAELRAMVAPLGSSFHWEYGVYRYPMGGKGYYFFGVPARPVRG